jgi:hypothetical protein
MKIQLVASVAGAIVVFLLANVGADALPCPWFLQECVPPHAAPAPLLAAGIPAFAALGGGLAVRKLWRKFRRF